MKKAKWIWYPGEFEQNIANPTLFRRDYRLVIEPPFWKIDAIFQSVFFFKTVKLEKAEKIKITSDSEISVKCTLTSDHLFKDETGYYTLPIGEYEITISAYNKNHKLPAIFIEGDTVNSDCDFLVSTSCSRGDKIPVGFSETLTKEQNPNDFSLSIKETPYSDKKVIQGSTIYDFGKETIGYVKLYGIKGKGKIFLYYGESLEEALDTEHCETYDIVDITCDLKLYENDKTRGFRYLNVCTQNVTVDDISLLYEYLPLKCRGGFTCSDELINQIFNTSLYTLQLNSRETFLDGIKRDRWFWSGDAYQSYLMNYYSFFDKEINQRTMWALRGKGVIDRHINHITDYTFYWFISLYDYYLFTNDTAFLNSIYASSVELMNFCLSLQNARGFIEGRDCDWVFVDWADMPKEGELSVEQILFYQSLKSMGELAELLGDKANAELYKSTAEKLLKNIFEVFYNKETGVFHHQAINGKATTLVTRYSNIFAITFDLLDIQRKNKVIQNVLLNDDILKITTPYCKFYELTGLCEADKCNDVLKIMREYWGGMLNLGATSFWEQYDPDETDHYSMYGRPYGKSLCHAWGASPVYLLGRYFLGVSPTSAGYATYKISPKLGDLEFIKGSVPTPNGDVFIYMDRQKLEITGVIGCVGEVVIDDRSLGFVNGNETKSIKL